MIHFPEIMSFLTSLIYNFPSFPHNCEKFSVYIHYNVEVISMILFYWNIVHKSWFLIFNRFYVIWLNKVTRQFKNVWSKEIFIFNGCKKASRHINLLKKKIESHQKHHRRKLRNVEFKLPPLSLVQFSRSVMSDSLQPHGLQQASLSIPNSRSSPKLMSMESVLPSSHLILSFFR